MSEHKMIFLLIMVFISINLISCSNENPIETEQNKSLNKDAHAYHVGPCVFAWRVGTTNPIPVSNAHIEVYQNFVKVYDLGYTDASGWVHHNGIHLPNGWYVVQASNLWYWGSGEFYYDNDGINHYWVKVNNW